MNPTPDQIRAARAASHLSQADAATVIYSKLRTWQDWESGVAKMHLGLFELFLFKTNQLPLILSHVA
jgi:hypothetical protein